jgi:hypothetical protein
MIRRLARPARRAAGALLVTALAVLLAPPDAALALPAERLSLVLSGRVFDHTGKAAKRAAVVLEGAHASNTLTADDGHYTIDVPLDGLRESAPHTVLLALHVERGHERFTLADGSDTVRVEIAVLPGLAGANVMMRSNSEAALTAVLGALKTSSGRGEFRGDQATSVPVQLLFFGRSSGAGAPPAAAPGTAAATASGAAMPYQDAAFLEGVEAAPPSGATGASPAPGGTGAAPAAGAMSAPTAPPPSAPTASASSRAPQHSAPSTAAAVRAPAAPSTVDTTVAAHASRPPSVAHAPNASEASETHVVGGTVSTTGTMAKIFSSPSGGIPVLTPSAPDSAALARALSPCECRVEGTIEVSSNQPLPHPFNVIVSLADEPACRDTVALFMGPPRPFTLLHVPCGAHPIDVALPRPEHFQLSGGAAGRTADCARGHARDVRLVLTHRPTPEPSN